MGAPTWALIAYPARGSGAPTSSGTHEPCSIGFLSGLDSSPGRAGAVAPEGSHLAEAERAPGRQYDRGLIAFGDGVSEGVDLARRRDRLLWGRLLRGSLHRYRAPEDPVVVDGGLHDLSQEAVRLGRRTRATVE